MPGRKRWATGSAPQRVTKLLTPEQFADALVRGGYGITGQEFPSQRQSLLATAFPVDTREYNPA
jgi:hypothetical protein